PGAYGSISKRESLPILGPQQARFALAHVDEPTSSVEGSYPNTLITSDCKDIPVPMSLQPDTQVQVASIDRIGHHPRNGDLCFPDSLDHLSGEFALGLKANRLGNACLATPIRIVDPFFGKIQSTVNERMAVSGDIVQKHGNLTVLDLSCGSTILHLDAC